jgi:RND family efflux transporter MFP subunit
MRKVVTLLLFVFSLNAGEIYATFNVEADKSANLAFDASGIVKKVNVSVASFVKQGDIVAVLENADKQATLDIAKTTLKFAAREYKRQEKIQKLIDASKFDKYAFEYENAKNQLDLQQALYNKTFLRAPFDGVITYKDIEVGDTVSGLMLKTVFKIQTKSKRKLIVEFDQKYHNIVKIGDKFKYKIDAEGESYSGVISKIYPYADTNNRKIKAEVEVKDIMVGLFGDGYIIVADKK